MKVLFICKRRYILIVLNHIKQLVIITFKKKHKINKVIAQNPYMFATKKTKTPDITTTPKIFNLYYLLLGLPI